MFQLTSSASLRTVSFFLMLFVGFVSTKAESDAREFASFEATSPPPTTDRWQQVWIDEFDSFDNDPYTNDRWSFDLGNDWANTSLGWGNKEYQYYTSDPKNIRAENGNLIIKVQVETDRKPVSSDGVAFDFTSARIATRGHESWGVNHRFIARAKLPTARTTWPAFWMLSEQHFPGDPEAKWPRGGELDIMEHWTTPMNMVSSATHCLGTDGQTLKSTSKQVFVENGEQYFADFHDYELQLRPDRVDFFIDSKWTYGLLKQGCLDSGVAWPWTNRNFHLLLNLALIEHDFDYANKKQEIIDAINNASLSTKQFIIDRVIVEQLLVNITE